MNALILDTETESLQWKQKQLLLLHVFISNIGNNLTASVFHKCSCTGLILDFTSFTSRKRRDVKS